MKKIGILSDTHGMLDERVFEHFALCDEVWHAGDIGSLEVLNKLQAFKPLRAVWGISMDTISEFCCRNTTVLCAKM